MKCAFAAFLRSSDAAGGQRKVFVAGAVTGVVPKCSNLQELHRPRYFSVDVIGEELSSLFGDIDAQ